MALSTNRLMLTGLLAASFLMAHAQTPGIDPALLGKANGGDAAAQVKVGECYENGQGVARDGKQAAEWYRRAAEQRSVSGALHLAEIYRDGDGRIFRAIWSRLRDGIGRPRTRAMLERRAR